MFFARCLILVAGHVLEWNKLYRCHRQLVVAPDIPNFFYARAFRVVETWPEWRRRPERVEKHCARSGRRGEEHRLCVAGAARNGRQPGGSERVLGRFAFLQKTLVANLLKRAFQFPKFVFIVLRINRMKRRWRRNDARNRDKLAKRMADKKKPSEYSLRYRATTSSRSKLMETVRYAAPVIIDFNEFHVRRGIASNR